MTPDEMKQRCKAFALRCVKLAESLPRGRTGDVIARQLIRSGTSAAANYRAVCSSRSHPDFLNKLGIVEEETDEALFWIEFTADANLTKPDRVADLIAEAKELLSIVVASQKTAKARRRNVRAERAGKPKRPSIGN